MSEVRSLRRKTNQLIYKRRLWARYRRAGACGECGVPVDTGHARCFEHRIRNAKRKNRHDVS